LLVASDWYQKLFPQTILADDQNTKHKFSTTQRGFRFATSIGGTVTGEGGEFLIVDDPHNPQQANSPLMRKKSIDWFEQSFISRLDNKKTGAIVIIMQRLHENDLTGHLLNKKNSLWQSLTIPAIATHDTTFTNNISRNEGNVLHLARESFEQLMQTQAEIGSYAFAAQYQQSPITIEGAMVKPKWIQRYDEIPQEIIKIVQSWDTAIKTNTNNDYSVVTTWAETRAGYHLLEVKRAKMEYPELKKFSTAYGIKWGAAAILIEDKASGQSLIQDLKRETNLPIIAVKPSKDKVTRFATVTPLFEAGKIFLPRCAPWLAEYENELLSFPSSTSDDQIDSTSQFLNWSRNNNYQGSRIRVI
jgi:predicted phage terminase large subunit-like protein